MDEPLPVKKIDVFNQEYEVRNEKSKETLRNVYYARAMNILRVPPFQYSEGICNDVASDVIDRGARLQTNAMAEDDDEDKEMNELNSMGETFQGLEKSTLLFLTVDDGDHNADEEMVGKLVPMPSQPRYNVKRESASSLPQCLQKMKSFLHYIAPRSLSATVVVLGKLGQDGVTFGNGATIPRDVLERQAQKIVGESGEHCPFTLDVVFLGKGDQVHVTTIPRPLSNTQEFNPTRVILEP